MMLVYNLLLYDGNHSPAATERERPYFQERREQLPIYAAFLRRCRYLCFHIRLDFECKITKYP